MRGRKKKEEGEEAYPAAPRPSWAFPAPPDAASETWPMPGM